MTKRKKAEAATKSRASTAKNVKPDGSISSGIYDAVEKLTADGNMKRADAFRQIANESGRKEGTVAVNYYYVAKKRRGGKKAVARKVTAKPASMTATKTKASTSAAGSISATIYDAIEKLVADGKMTRAAAFRQHAKATGRKEGTVSVNYYYAAKKRGSKPAQRGPGRPKMTAGKRAGAAGSRIEGVLKSLIELIRSQESELKQLRGEGERIAAIRQLMSR